jgi:excisionase family DNA binding protein
MQFAMSLGEACAATGVGLTRLRGEITAGRLEAKKVGRRTLIEVAEIERWLRELPAASPRAA